MSVIFTLFSAVIFIRTEILPYILPYSMELVNRYTYRLHDGGSRDVFVGETVKASALKCLLYSLYSRP